MSTDNSDLKKGGELSSRYRLWSGLIPTPADCPNIRRQWRKARLARQFGQARQLAYDYWQAKTSLRRSIKTSQKNES